MENTYLNAYRAKVYTLNDDELFLRDLYLKKLHDGIVLGPLTGDSRLDRPFVKNFKAKPTAEINVYKTLYENLLTVAATAPDKVILFSGDGKLKTYKQLIDEVEKAASGFEKIGIKTGSRIGAFFINSIDEATVLFAANKLGAQVKYIDYSKDINNIMHSMENIEIDILVMDKGFEQLLPIVNTKGLPVIFTECDEMINTGRIYSISAVEQIGSGNSSSFAGFDANRPSVGITSSGTTGIPKPIVHSDYSVNCTARKIMYADFGLGENYVILKAVPSHIGMGLIGTLYQAVMSKTAVYLNKGFSPEDAAKNVLTCIAGFKKFRELNSLDENTKLTIFASPMFYKLIAEHIEMYDDLSFLGTLLSGGSKISSEEIERIYQTFSAKGCRTKIVNAYGQNEMNLTSCNYDSSNHLNTAGFPTIGTYITIVDNEYKYLGAGQRGRILEKSDARFLCYDGLDEQTKNAFVKTEDGTVWFDTQDMGELDKNGILTITGRFSRSMIRHDCKISLDVVEGKFRSHPKVKDCIMVALDRQDNENDLPVLYLAVTDSISFEQILDDLLKAKIEIGMFERPEYIEICEELPYLNSGKADIQTLTKMAREKYL